MAELLKRQYDLFSLKLELDTERDSPVVVCTPETSAEGELTRLPPLRYPASAFNIPERIEPRDGRYQGHGFTLPPEFVDLLADALRQRLQPQEPVWLHLAGPSGYLRYLPWEELLQPPLTVPLLRLPEFLVGAPKRKKRLRCVLCASMPRAKSNFHVPAILERTIERLVDVMQDRVSFEVFADLEFISAVKTRFEGRGWIERGQVTLHDPRGAAEFDVPEPTRKISEQLGRVESPWLLWIRKALGGKSADVVHFLGHGFFSEPTSAICFSESPLINEDSKIARFVGPHEIVTFCTQIGAWSLTLSSAPENYSRMGLRGVTHTVAQLRPGPVVHHEYELDSDLAALGASYHFLYGDARLPPATPAIITYCHPARVSDAGWKATRALNTLPEELETKVDALCAASSAQTDDAGPETPLWAAAASRFVEQRALQLKQVRGAGTAAGRSAGETAGLGDTLTRIQGVIAKALKEPQG